MITPTVTESTSVLQAMAEHGIRVDDRAFARHVETVLVRLAELERRVSELTEQPPAWAVQWIDPVEPDAAGTYIEEESREDAERIAAGFPDAHLRVAKVYRGPWLPVVIT